MKKTTAITIFTLIMIGVATTGVMATITIVNQNGYKYATTGLLYTAYIKENSNWGDGIKYCVTINQTEKCLTYQAQDLSYRDSNGAQDYIQSIGSVTAIVNGDTINYPEIFPGINLTYTFMSNKMKENIILAQKPREPAVYLGENITLDIGGYIKYDNDVEIWANGAQQTGDFKTSGEISFKYQGKELFRLYKPYAISTDGTYKEYHTGYTDMEYEVKKQGNQIFFYTKTPYEYLNWPNITYPVYIDPTSGLHNETAPIFCYITADGNAGTEVANFTNFMEDNSIQNFTKGASIDQDWTNVTPANYDPVCDLYFVAGKSSASSATGWLSINQTTRGIVISTRNYNNAVNWCNTTDPFAGTTATYTNLTGNVFNTSNGLTSGANAMYTTFKDFTGCGNQIMPVASNWAGTQGSGTEYHSGAFDNNTAMMDWTTQARWVSMPTEESVNNFDDLTTLAKNLYPYAFDWVVDMNRIYNYPPSTPTNLTANGTANFNGNFSGTIPMQCSGSTDTEEDNITYEIWKNNISTTTGYIPTTGYISEDSDGGSDTITASGENCGSECKEDLFDRNTGTKWLVFTNTGWIKIQLATPNRTMTYAITSGNDAPDRDPDDWTIEGSTDGTNWDIIDIKTNQETTFASRSTTYQFTMNQPTNTSYTYYRWNISEIRTPSANILQVSELWLNVSQPTTVSVDNWNTIGNHTEGQNLSWDTSSDYEGEIYEGFRCRAIDENGSTSWSNFYEVTNTIFEIASGGTPPATYYIDCSTNPTTTSDTEYNESYYLNGTGLWTIKHHITWPNKLQEGCNISIHAPGGILTTT